jgi:hypothetical protein
MICIKFGWLGMVCDRLKGKPDAAFPTVRLGDPLLQYGYGEGVSKYGQ